MRTSILQQRVALIDHGQDTLKPILLLAKHTYLYSSTHVA